MSHDHTAPQWQRLTQGESQSGQRRQHNSTWGLDKEGIWAGEQPSNRQGPSQESVQPGQQPGGFKGFATYKGIEQISTLWGQLEKAKWNL